MKKYTVPAWDKPELYKVKPRAVKGKWESTLDKEDQHKVDDLKAEITIKKKQIKALKAEVADLLFEVKKLRYKKYGHKTIKLYVLKCVDGCWYVGSSWNPETRFKKHLNGKGAKWTKLHPPIEIAKVIDTKTDKDYEVAPMEDELTLQYAEVFGTQFVRGGGYCQTKPRWPKSLF